MENQIKILIVEDDDLLQSALMSRFQTEGYNVLVANNGEEGLALFLSETPNVVISDVVMPKMDGVQMFAQIKEKRPDDMTPIIMLTNSDDMNNLASALKNHTVTHLLKSGLKLDDLVKIVKEKLGL